MRRRSLTTRLTLSHVLVTLAGLLLLGVALIVIVQRNQRTQALANLTAQANVYAAYASEVALDTNILTAISPTLIRRFNIGPETTLRVLAPNGAVLFASRNLGSFPSTAALAMLTNPLPIQPVAREDDRRFAAQRVVRGDETIGVVEVSQPTAREIALVRQLAGALLPSAALALIGAALAGHLLARSLVRPLRRLGRVASLIAAGNTDTRSNDRSQDEIGQVASQLNRMADELQARLADVERLADSRQQFYRTVSHELRTPLTAIRGTAENLEDDATLEQRAELAVIQSEAARLQRLVEELLNPRDTVPSPLRRRQPVDVGVLVADVMHVMQPRADRSGITLTSATNGKLIVAGDADRLKQALLNLIDNALTWTPPGGQVIIAAQRLDNGAYVSVRDTGPGIDDSLRERIWERGFSASGGQGVGLALVRDVVVAHGGTVALADGAATEFVLSLPLIPQS
jgi:two-component system sensor histidine kinase BaeS